MDIERLEELREETEQYRAVADDRYMSTNYEDDLLALIDEAIARQSIKSEDVAEAIKHLKNENGFTNGKLYRAVDLAITALQACQTKEPCDYCKSGIDTVSLMDSDMLMRFVSKVNYCPNCGQKLDWSEE